jgi:GTPase Era involved in 16S rRNA processing
VTRDDAQLVLVDLPGWQRPIDPLTERMQDRVEETIADDLDAIVLVVTHATESAPATATSRAASSRSACRS